MLEERTHKTAFFSAPQSVKSLVAAFVEPTLTVLVFLLATVAFGQAALRSDLALCVLVIALTFPGTTASRTDCSTPPLKSSVRGPPC